MSVVVVNYRTPDLTAEAVRSALAEPEVVEAVVVDNGSGDGSVEELSAKLSGLAGRVGSLQEKHGFGGGADRGGADARGIALLFLNSDAVVKPGSIRRMVDGLGPEVGAVAPLIVGPDGRTPQVDAFGSFPSLRTLLLRTNRHPDDEVEPDWVSGVALLMKRSTFERLGGFDEAYRMYLEDVDLCRRIRRAGLIVRRARDAEVVHLGGGSYASSKLRDAAYHQSLLQYLERAGCPIPLIAALAPLHRCWQGSRRLLRRPGDPPSTAP